MILPGNGKKPKTPAEIEEEEPIYDGENLEFLSEKEQKKLHQEEK